MVVFYWGSKVSLKKILKGETVPAYARLDWLSHYGGILRKYGSYENFLKFMDRYNWWSPITYSEGLTDYIYLPGDFSLAYNYFNYVFRNSLEFGRKDKYGRPKNGIGYNLYQYNCMQASLTGLMYCKNAINHYIWQNAINMVFPNDAFDYLKQNKFNIADWDAIFI